MYIEKLKATIDGIEYTWGGGFGAVLYSFERGVKINDVRIIAGHIFYAYLVERSGWYRQVNWVPHGKLDIDWIRKFKKEIFS